jgi:hypothetical protein
MIHKAAEEEAESGAAAVVGSVEADQLKRMMRSYYRTVPLDEWGKSFVYYI